MIEVLCIMSCKQRITVRAVGVALGLAIMVICADCGAATPSSGCVDSATSRDGVVAAAAEMFAALRTDDLDRFQMIVAPVFYAFDAGRRFDGNGLAVFVKEAHAKGMRFTWSITEPTVHMGC